MTPFWRIIIGLAMIGTGGVLVWWSGQPLWRKRQECLAWIKRVAGVLKKWFDKTLPKQEALHPGDLKLERRKHPQRFRHQVNHLIVPMHDTGNVNLSRWAANIANNIYLRASDEKRGDVRGVLKKSAQGSYRLIEEENRLLPYGQIRILVNEDMLHRLRHGLAMSQDKINGQLAHEIREYMSLVLEPNIWESYHPTVHMLKHERLDPTVFNLRFHAAPPQTADGDMTFDAAVSFRPAAGKVHAGVHFNLFRVADRELPGSYYLPLIENFSDEVTIGPYAWCHIQTDRTKFGSTLTLGWRPSDDVGFAGVLDVFEYEGQEPLFLEIEGKGRIPFNRPGSFVRVPAAEGPHTTASLLVRREESEQTVGTLTLANPLPDISSLPQVIAFEKIHPRVDDAEQFAKFLATQIYLATQGEKRDIAFLDEDDGRKLMEQKGWLDGNIVTPDGKLVLENGPCYRLKLVVSPLLRKRIRDWFGHVATARGLVTRIREVFTSEGLYADLLEDDAKRALKPSDNHPGLSVELSEDRMTPPGALLLRATPLLLTERRREIFGELLFSGWEGARDISGMSSNPQRNFLIQYPKGFIKMRMSRFPLYGILAPQVNGVIAIGLEDPGRDDAVLTVENKSQAKITLGDRIIPPEEEASIEVSFGKKFTFFLQLEDQSLQIIIYDQPKPQFLEPEFLPAPGKFHFHGLTLSRRIERANVRAGEFNRLWNAARKGHKLTLNGVSGVTRLGYLASVVRDKTQREVHFLTGGDAELTQNFEKNTFKGGGHTLEGPPLSNELTIEEPAPAPKKEDEQPGDALIVNYTRPELRGDLSHVINADILIQDYYDRWYDELMGFLPEGHAVTEVDLLRCHPKDLKDFARHLYLAVDREDRSRTTRGWLFCPGGDIHRICADSPDKVLEIDCSGPLVGPLDVTRFFWVDWDGERRTPVTFEIASHRDQVETYLSDGFFSLPPKGVYRPGGNLGANKKPFAGVEDLFIGNQTLRLTYSREAVRPENQLRFDPRDLVNYFDKDSFSLYYNAAQGGFVVKSELHIRTGITPKTIFLILPSSDAPILGSHALPPVAIPNGQNHLVFPGLTFKSSQGPDYYGFVV